MRTRSPRCRTLRSLLLREVYPTPQSLFCDREWGGGYHQGAMHLGEPIFIFILAFVLLGPKKTSDLARQVGKLMAEFRKASNDFKYQFNEEMRVSEQQERQKKQDAERAALGAGSTGADTTILPPVAAGAAMLPSAEAVPYAVSAVSATTGEESSTDDHPLLRVDVIPPMDGTPGDPHTDPIHVQEPDEASVHRG